MSGPKLLFYSIDGQGSILKRIDLAYVKFFAEMGMSVTTLELMDKAQNEILNKVPGVTVGKPFARENWNDYDIVVVRTPIKSQSRDALTPYVLKALEQNAIFNGLLGTTLDDPRDQIWHWGLNGPNPAPYADLVKRGYDFAFCLPDAVDGYVKSEFSSALAKDLPLIPFAPYGFVQDLANPDFTLFKNRPNRVYYYGLYKLERWNKVKAYLSPGRDSAYFGSWKPLRKTLEVVKSGKIVDFCVVQPDLLKSNASLVIGSTGHAGALTMRLPEALENGAIPLIERALDPKMTIVSSPKFYFDSPEEFDSIIASVTEEDMREQIDHVVNFSKGKAIVAYGELCKLL